MKKILIVLPFCFLAMTGKKAKSISIPECMDLKRGLIAYYPFNGNANDESGNNKNGKLVNGPTFSTDANNIDNKAANFDGVDDYILVSDQTNYFAPPKLSVAFQVYFRNAAGRSSIICKSAFTTASAVSWGAYLTDQLGFTVADATDACSDLWYDNPGADLHTQGNFRDYTWYHITLIFNQGVEMVYINGILNSAKVSDHTYLKQCNNADLKFGGWWQDDIVSIQGKLDEVRLYDRILSEEEIETLAKEINGCGELELSSY